MSVRTGQAYSWKYHWTRNHDFLR